MPNSAHFNNNKSAITHSDFVSEAIQDLLEINRIIEVNELPHVVKFWQKEINTQFALC